MARKKTLQPVIEGNEYTVVPFEVEMDRDMARYASEAAIRAIPDVRDGCKPVHRRIIYTMYANHMTHTAKHTKMASVCGLVLAYHPHGDASVYDAAVRLSQDWVNTLAFVEVEGNNGSTAMPGDHAAARYTEGRLSPAAQLMTEGLKDNAVDVVDNYDGTKKEPRDVLPAAVPVLFINGGRGSGVGFSTHIAPHNPSEMIEAARLYNKNPNVSLKELMDVVPGPSFPTGNMLSKKDIVKLYKTGEATLSLQCRYTIDDSGNNADIIFTEIPYATGRTSLSRKEAIESINAAIVDGGAMSLVTGPAEDASSADEGEKIVIACEKGVDPARVVDIILARSVMCTTASFSHYGLVEGVPELLSLRRYLGLFVEFRTETIRRVTQCKRDRARDAEHTIDGFLWAAEHSDVVVKTMRESRGKKDACARLQKLGLSAVQAEAVATLPLHRLSALDVESWKKSKIREHNIVVECEKILGSPQRLSRAVDKSLAQARKLVDRVERTTKIVDDITRPHIPATFVADEEETVVVVKPHGAQRMSEFVWDNNKDSWPGTIVHVMHTTTAKGVVMLTKRGRLIQRVVCDIAQESVKNPAEDFRRNIETFKKDDEIIAACEVDFSRGEHENLAIVSLTKKGQAKKSVVSDSMLSLNNRGYLTRSKIYNGLKKSGDEVIWARIVPEAEADKMKVTVKKKSGGRRTVVKFSDVSQQGGSGSGVRVVNPKNDDDYIFIV